MHATLELSPLRALIGPNDSGKSMTLRAIDRVIEHMVGVGVVWSQNVGGAWRMANDTTEYSLTVGSSHHPREKLVARARTLRLDPDAMREAQPLLVDGAPFDFMNERGAGLGRLVDGLLARSLADREKLEAQFLSMFAPNTCRKACCIFLAFSLLPYIEKPSMLLIEEPENGLHPARIKDVVRILREVSKTTQIVLATQSPLIINELKPHEVTLVTRTETEGTKFTRMDKTPHFIERSEAWNLGELWLALSDGVSEEPLLNPKRKS